MLGKVDAGAGAGGGAAAESLRTVPALYSAVAVGESNTWHRSGQLWVCMASGDEITPPPPLHPKKSVPN